MQHAGRRAGGSVTVRIRTAKTCDVSDSECGVIVGATPGASAISEAATFLGFSHTAEP